MTKDINGYVLTSDGRYLVQLAANDNAWGFVLADGEGQTWPGGFGIASEWMRVNESKVPSDAKAELSWLLES